MLALGAAAAFGLTAPLVQRFGRDVGPFTTAGLLYVGAALACAIRRSASGEAAVQTRHLPRIAVAAVAGAFMAPVCLAFGLQRASGTAASLMLNLEAVFTVVLAAAVLREHVSSRAAIAILSMLAGGVSVVIGDGLEGSGTWVGLAAVGLATLGWAVDNVVLRPLADLDPVGVVFRKAVFGLLLSLGAARAWGEPLPSTMALGVLVACGATGYGLSLRLYLRAQRRVGAGRTGSMFGIAPFLSGAVAWGLGQGDLGIATALGAACFGIGAYLHATERHEHLHVHEALEHDHAHRHDDGHHEHQHEPPVLGQHSHRHRHEAVGHRHAHAPDIHHAHRHK
jgi:drug/metabolite transporter (DMT)-like permease